MNGGLADMNLGRDAEALKHTLRTSKIRGEMEDPAMRCPRLMPRYWLVRAFIGFALLAKCVEIITAAASPIAGILQIEPGGWALLAIVAGLSFLIVADVAVNDFQHRYEMPWTKNGRHWIYIGVALFTMALTYVIVRRGGYHPSLLTFWVDATMAAIVGGLDLIARHREAT